MNAVPCETLHGRISYLYLPEVLDTTAWKVKAVVLDVKGDDM
jgi:hypothetical protein